MKVNLPKLKCSNCGHEWIPAQENVKICPNCKVKLENHPAELSRSQKSERD